MCSLHGGVKLEVVSTSQITEMMVLMQALQHGSGCQVPMRHKTQDGCLDQLFILVLNDM